MLQRERLVEVAVAEGLAYLPSAEEKKEEKIANRSKNSTQKLFRYLYS